MRRAFSFIILRKCTKKKKKENAQLLMNPIVIEVPLNILKRILL